MAPPVKRPRLDSLDSAAADAQPIGVDVLLEVVRRTAGGFVDADAQKTMHRGLDDHPRVTLHDYEGLDHGFATQFGKRRDEQGAQLADKRTAEFFAKHLA